MTLKYKYAVSVARGCSGLKKARGTMMVAAAAMMIGAGLTSSAWAQACENPDELTFAIIPTEETVAELELYQPVTDRLAKETGKKIQFFMPTSYAAVVEATERKARFGSGKGLLTMADDFDAPLVDP